MPDHNKQLNQSLTDRIAELEALLARNKTEREPVPVLEETAALNEDPDEDIPILDELVPAEDADVGQLETESPSATAEQLLDLINNIENRLTDELETLVGTLKSTMKESIINELITRLEAPADTEGKSPQQQPDHAFRRDDENS